MNTEKSSESDLVHPKEHCKALVANSLIRASYSLSTIQKRILNLLFAQVQIRAKDFEPLEIRAPELARAIGVTDQNYDYVRAGIKALMREVVDIDTEEGWIMHHWVSTAKYIKRRDVFLFELHQELLPYVLDFKNKFAIIAQSDLNKLQGKYSIRIYELIMANEGFKGDKGNPKNTWFTDLEFDQLRQLFKIGNNEYKLTADFRKNIVDYPVREINNAHIGLKITTDYDKFRYGRSLLGVRLLCEWVGFNTRVANPPKTQTENEDEKLIKKHYDLYQAFYQIEKDSPEFDFVDKDSTLREINCQARAVKSLKEHLAKQKAQEKKKTKTNE